MCAHKDKHQLRNHDDIKVDGSGVEVPNLQVCNLMKSLKSRGYVKESFNWQWFYWYLTNEGIEYRREYLHLPTEVMPNTLKKQAAKPQGRPGGYQGEEGGGGGFGRGGGFSDDPKKGGAPGDYRPAFGGGEGGGGEYLPPAPAIARLAP